MSFYQSCKVFCIETQQRSKLVQQLLLLQSMLYMACFMSQICFLTFSHSQQWPGSVAQWIARRTSSWYLRYSEAVGSSPTGVGEFFAPTSPIYEAALKSPTSQMKISSLECLQLITVHPNEISRQFWAYTIPWNLSFSLICNTFWGPDVPYLQCLIKTDFITCSSGVYVCNLVPVYV